MADLAAGVGPGPPDHRRLAQVAASTGTVPAAASGLPAPTAPGARDQAPALTMRVATFSAALWATAGSTEVYVSAVSTMLE